MKCLFWGCALLIFYTYAGYPLVLYLRTRWRPRPIQRKPVTPSVSVIMAVHNEADMLPRKLRDLLAMDYPVERLEIVVISDGSSDATPEILRDCSDARLHFIIAGRQGKAMAVNQAAAAAKGEILVFMDVRQVIAPDAVKKMVRNFADPSVGCVSGEIFLGHPQAGASANGLGLYWKIESNIRRWEGAIGHLVAAAGCLHAVRRSLYSPLPAGTILDDIFRPLLVARQGARVVLETEAIGWDREQTDSKLEFRRKVRTLTGNYQLMRMAPWIFTSENPFRFEFVSHKALRLLAPFALFGMLIASFLLRGTFYEFAGILQAVFYGFAFLGLLQPKFGRLGRLADVSSAFLLLNAAAVVALYYFISGKREVWVR